MAAGAVNKDRLMDVTQVAKRLCVGRSTVYRLIEQGDLPASKHGTAYCIRVREGDVEQFIRANRDAANI